MAKKKSATKKKYKRIGAMAISANSPLVKYGAIAAGYFLGNKINDAIDKAVGTNIDGKLIAGGQVGIGYMLALRKGGKQSTVKTVIGGLMLGAGAKRLIGSVGLGNISGYQSVPVVGGYQKVPVVGGTNAKRIGGYTTAPNGGINGYSPNRASISRSMIGGIGNQPVHR